MNIYYEGTAYAGVSPLTKKDEEGAGAGAGAKKDEETTTTTTKPADPNELGDPTDLPAGARRVHLYPDSESNKKQMQVWGLTRTLLSNAVTGVTEGYQLPIRLNGVGYRAAIVEQQQQPEQPEPGREGKEQQPRQPRPVLSLRLGYPKPVELVVPEGVTCLVPNPTNIMLMGPDKRVLGEFAAKARHQRKPEPYKQKGVFVGGETIKKKEGKKGK